VLALKTDARPLVTDLCLGLVQVETETDEEPIGLEAHGVPKKALAPPTESGQNLGIR